MNTTSRTTTPNPTARPRPRRRGVWLIAGLLGLGGLAWQLAGPTAAAQASPGDRDPFPAVVASIRPSIVAVGSYYFKDTPTVQYHGTGFVVHDGRTIVTNAHVVESLRKNDRIRYMRVFFPDATSVDGREVTIWNQDNLHDVALLRLDGPAATPLPMDITNEPAQGEAVGVLGYPIGMKLGLVPAAHRGVVSAVVPAVLPLPSGTKMTPQLAEALKHPYNLYQLDLVVYPGNSGSPLFDTRTGAVVGIINKTLANKTREHLLESPSGISYAVPARWIRELIIRSTLTHGPSGIVGSAAEAELGD